MVWDPRALGPQIPPEVHVPPAHPQFRQPQEAQPESKVQQQLQLKHSCKPQLWLQLRLLPLLLLLALRPQPPSPFPPQPTLQP